MYNYSCSTHCKTDSLGLEEYLLSIYRQVKVSPFAGEKNGVFSGIYLKIRYLEEALIADGLLCKLHHWKHDVRIKNK